MGGNNPSAANTSTSGSTPPSSGSGAGGLGGLLGSNFTQDYMQQMMQNPRQLDAMLNTPYMQSMLQMISSNPEMARLMVESSPQLAGNPELREQMTRSMPAMLQQVWFIKSQLVIFSFALNLNILFLKIKLQNPEMRALLTNSEAIQAIMQIQQGMQRLQAVAPSNVISGYVNSNERHSSFFKV